MELTAVVESLARAGVVRLYGKALAANDNSKNQVYLGGSMQAVNLLPAKDIVPDPKNPKRLKAPIRFGWLDPSTGEVSEAPSAQLILYPDYPEVRMSGFLAGSENAPSDLMASRAPGRVLLLGVRKNDQILGIALGPGSAAAREFIARQDSLVSHGVLRELAVTNQTVDDNFATLMTSLSSVHHKGWIHSWQLGANGERRPCEAQNCGGYTLEAELGIQSNGRCEPDFLGWEVKSFDVPTIDEKKPSAKVLTLMTPEPTGAMYRDDFEDFWRRYSYPDRSGKPAREGRRNFGGVYRCGEAPHETTGLRLVLDGFDGKSAKFETGGQLALVDCEDRIAASWSFVTLLDRWSRKHSRAVYVPSERHGDEPRRYRYGSRVSLGQGTDFSCFLKAVAVGAIYLDPALKLEGGKFKKRNQFRVQRRNLGTLYTRFSEEVDVDAQLKSA